MSRQVRCLYLATIPNSFHGDRTLYEGNNFVLMELQGESICILARAVLVLAFAISRQFLGADIQLELLGPINSNNNRNPSLIVKYQ